VVGSDLKSELTEAAKWWVKNYETLKKGGDFTINLMNQWGSDNQIPATFAKDITDAINILKEAKVYKPHSCGGDHHIVIDCPGWGQDIQTCALAAPNIDEKDDKSMILSAHIYPGAWN